MLLLAAGACASSGGRRPTAPAGTGAEKAADAHSHARPHEVRVRHVALDLALDFDGRRVRGAATLDLERAAPGAPLVLDSHGLRVLRVVGADGEPRAHEIGAETPRLGAPLRIALGPDDRQVRIEYESGEEAEALQWLTPEQTHARRRPFLFTQGEAIYTRSWIPLQDSPSVRITYEARVRAPEGMTVLMSAEALGRDADGAFRFRMTQPIPPYLVALAAGELEFAPLSDRAGVWAEPTRLEAARQELVDTERMIAAAEGLFGAYRWGRYDVLILPPAFPFGGMENPRLTFATPTILAGDRSLVSLVAHELAHSWSGNLVTNATWRDFWLNEGFTVYFQHRIMETVYGPERAALERALARNDLEEELRTLEPWQQVLHVDLTGRHPDDAFSGVPYEKGALLLLRLEALFGRPAFDRFLRGYFDGHAFTSITTADFVRTLQRDLLSQDPAKAAALDLTAWLERPGLPDDAPRFTSDALARVDAQRARFVAGTPASALDTQGWVTQQWQHFINTLPPELPTGRLAELDAAFGFSRSGNAEILSDWLVQAVRRGYRGADERLASFLVEVGRRKFLKPIYTELARTPEGLARARAIYAKARPGYHAVARGTMDKLLGWTADGPGGSSAR